MVTVPVVPLNEADAVTVPGADEEAVTLVTVPSKSATVKLMLKGTSSSVVWVPIDEMVGAGKMFNNQPPLIRPTWPVTVSIAYSDQVPMGLVELNALNEVA
jgi:hypothetical protein